MKIVVLKETTEGERRVAVSPETVKKFIALGATVAVEKGAGAFASVRDADLEAAGATLGTRAAVIKDADILLGVQGPTVASLKGVKSGVWLVGPKPVRRAQAC
jgi:H+-translocating NAD(P) transhydrogenase subunit alpha